MPDGVRVCTGAAHPPYYPHDVFAVGDRLYVNYSEQGYDIVDVSNPSDLRTLGNFSHRGPQYSHHNAVGTFAGRTIAFMGGEGPGEHLRVLDITDPAHIVKIGEFQLRAPISIHNMLLVGKKLYLSWYQEGVRVLDVSNPTRPTQVAYYNTFRESDPGRGDYYDGAIGIRVPGDGYLYVVDTSRGLMLLREP
ncbi:LVIVD repeat-containing protein [Archangium gephyra]|uniref:LVIVD repeat-containing protein n=1 Tax=Archangium gephyra TaxID=48 RepID=A0ABX9JLE4_9BACT|nr:LVIVD repeat-containing protein [Archangium gephyra]